MRIFSKLLVIILTACGPKKSTPTADAPAGPTPVVLATVHPFNDVKALNCSPEVCHIETATGLEELQIDAMTFKTLDVPPSPAT